MYGTNLAREKDVNGVPNPSCRDQDDRDPPVPSCNKPTKRMGLPDDRLTLQRKVRVNLKCAGTDPERALVAYVDQLWCPRRAANPGNGTKRTGDGLSAGNMSKRSKPSYTKSEGLGITISKNPESDSEEDECEENSSPDLPQVPGQIWKWVEDRDYFASISKKQPLPHDLTLEDHHRIGKTKLVAMQNPSISPRKVREKTGTFGVPYTILSTSLFVGLGDSVLQMSLRLQCTQSESSDLCGRLHYFDHCMLSSKNNLGSS